MLLVLLVLLVVAGGGGGRKGARRTVKRNSEKGDKRRALRPRNAPDAKVHQQLPRGGEGAHGSAPMGVVSDRNPQRRGKEGIVTARVTTSRVWSSRVQLWRCCRDCGCAAGLRGAGALPHCTDMFDLKSLVPLPRGMVSLSSRILSFPTAEEEEKEEEFSGLFFKGTRGDPFVVGSLSLRRFLHCSHWNQSVKTLMT